MGAKKTKVLLLIGAVVLFVLLFIAPKLAPKHPDDHEHDNQKGSTVSANGNLSVYLNMALKSLKPEEKKIWTNF